MSFVLRKDPIDMGADSFPISSQTLAVGDMITLGVGSTTWAAATSSSTHFEKKAVCIQAATSSDSFVKAIPVNDYQLWEVELANNSNTAHNGDRMVLTDKNTVNNTGTDSTAEAAVFVQKAPIGAVADKKALGWFIAGTGVDPDAA